MGLLDKAWWMRLPISPDTYVVKVLHNSFATVATQEAASGVPRAERLGLYYEYAFVPALGVETIQIVYKPSYKLV